MRRGALVLVMVAVTVFAGFPSAAADGFETRFVDIPGQGVTLSGFTMRPRSPGPHPLVVLAAPWSSPALYNVNPARDLADRGYTVVAYTERGFGGSTGKSDIAGAADVADLSAVIDWAIASTSADPERIGVAGVSYGAGLALLGAAADPRIDAVAALSGWSDFVASLHPGGTRAALVGQILHRSAAGSLTPEADRMLRGFRDPAAVPEEELLAWARARSPITVLDRINANAPAVLIAHAWNENVFTVGPMMDFFQRLTGPKHAELHPGDHASVEIPGMLGLPSNTWNAAYRWFDTHVAGTAAGEQWPAISAIPRPGAGRAAEHHGAWATAPNHQLRLGHRTIDLSRDTAVGAGLPIITHTLESLTGEPPAVWLPGVDQRAVWRGDRFPATARLRGAPVLALDIAPTAAEGTLVAYLLAEDRLGVGRMIGHIPVSWRQAGPRRAELRFQPVSYDIPAGHRLAVVLDGKDLLYADHNGEGAAAAVSGVLDLRIG